MLNKANGKQMQRALAVGGIKADECIVVDVHQLETIVGRGKTVINIYLRRYYDFCPFLCDSCKAFPMRPEFTPNYRKMYEHWHCNIIENHRRMCDDLELSR
jgi:hypothetical protein